MHLNQGYSYSEQLNQKADGQSVLSYLLRTYKHSSKEVWQTRLKQKEVFLNQHPAQGDEVLKAGQTLTWNRPPWREEATPQTYEIIHIDVDIIVVNKPSGLPTLPAGGFLENTLLYLLRKDVPEASPVHRLGRATSGLVVFARNRLAAKRLSENWHHIDKLYRALAVGLAEQDSYCIRTPIGPVMHPRLGKVFAANTEGKSAVSWATVLERRDAASLFAIRLGTGRPHQIRIHLASIGHPLLGDPLYGAGGTLLAAPGLPGDLGYCLHAEQLCLNHPSSNKRLVLKAENPDKLQILN